MKQCALLTLLRKKDPLSFKAFGLQMRASAGSFRNSYFVMGAEGLQTAEQVV